MSSPPAPRPGDGRSEGIWRHGHVIARNAAASTMGASVVALVVTPLDVMKVRMQSHVCSIGSGVPCVQPGHVDGMRDAFHKVVRADGVRGLWRGLSATLALAVPTTGVYFTVYEAFMARAAATPGVSDGVAAITCGASARVLTATAASPIELARIRVQAGYPGGMFSILKDVYRRDGMMSLWRGLGPTLIRDAPFSAIYWGVYEALKDPVRSPLPERMLGGEHNFSGFLLAGIGAGGLAAFVTVPADVVKTRRQASMGVTEGLASPREIARLILQEEGVRGFFRGAGPRVVKVAPACAIMMGTYELFKIYLGT